MGTSGSLTFLPGETTKSVTVTIFGDTTYEASETFFLNLSGINGALLVDGQGQATIENDDPGLILSVDDVSVAEGDSASPTATFTVSMPAAVPAGQTVTVSYTTADGTATAPRVHHFTAGRMRFKRAS